MLFLVWIILFLSGTIASFLFSYWYGLFLHQDRYTRAELLDIPGILASELKIIGEKGNPGFQLIAFSAGSLVMWLFTFLGGLVTPNRSLAPDLAEFSGANVFFQSILIPALFHFAFPLVRDLAAGNTRSPYFRIYSYKSPFLLGMSQSLIATLISVWGIYHETYFILAFASSLLAFAFSFYQIRTYQNDGDGPEDGFTGSGAEEDGPDSPPLDPDDSDDLDLNPGGTSGADELDLSSFDDDLDI